MDRLDAEVTQIDWRSGSHSGSLLAGPTIWVSRGLVYLTLCLLSVTACWLAIASLDVVVEARGRLVVEGQPIEITASEAALVVGVPVTVGQRVEKGETLIQLDAYSHESQANELRTEIEIARSEESRHLASARSLEITRASGLAEDDLMAASIELAEIELQRVRALANRGVASSMRVAQEENRLLEIRAQGARTHTAVARLDHDIAEQERLAAAAADRVAALQVRLDRAVEYRRRATIRAPVSGTIVKLAVRHPGSVVDTDAPVVVLAPDDQPLLARIDLPNTSMRGVRPGIETRIELDAFPREDYGDVAGRVLTIEPDADHSGRYKAWVRLLPDGTPPSVLAKGLKPGLLLDARLVVEHRRVLDFLVGPLRRLSGPLSVVE